MVMHWLPEDTSFERLAALHDERVVKYDSHFSGFAPRANLSHVNFLSDGTPEVAMMRKQP